MPRYKTPTGLETSCPMASLSRFVATPALFSVEWSASPRPAYRQFICHDELQMVGATTYTRKPCHGSDRGHLHVKKSSECLPVRDPVHDTTKLTSRNLVSSFSRSRAQEHQGPSSALGQSAPLMISFA